MALVPCWPRRTEGILPLYVRPFYQVNAVWYRGKNFVQRFPYRLWLPWQVEDERLAPNTGGLPRQYRGLYVLKADCAHLLAKPGHHLGAYCLRGLRGDVTGGRARSAGRDYETATRGVGLGKRQSRHAAAEGIG